MALSEGNTTISPNGLFSDEEWHVHEAEEIELAQIHTTKSIVEKSCCQDCEVQPNGQINLSEGVSKN